MAQSGSIHSLHERRPRSIAVLTFAGAQSLDVNGPIEVFAAAALLVKLADPSAIPPYRVEILAAEAGPVSMGSGIRLVADDLSVERLADRAGMSPRNFARVFTREMGSTPAKFVERARVDAARRWMEDGGLSLEDVAGRAGFSSAEHMRRTFHRHVRVVPHDYRKRFHLIEPKVPSAS